jgi:DNA (cytosine-5)-methyltransferase 1
MWGPPVFTSEIDKFPSAVLKHHMPDVPNYGDMTKYKEWPEHDIDVLVGGTPCQAFSVAGLRRSLDDERGNLTLTFLGLARKYQPRFIVWENVPGVLNTPDNAFGQFLAGLTGYDAELRPNGGRWSTSGFIAGPKRVAAWRVLDAQFFGVPQRRRRVFVIASPRDLGFAPCSILFEPQGMRRDIEKGGKEGESVTALTANGIGTCGADDNQAHGGHLVAFMSGQGAKAGSIAASEKTSPTLKSADSGTNRTPCIAVNARQDPITSKCAQPLDQKGNSQAVAFQRSELRQRGTLTMHDKAPTLKAETKQGDSELTILQPISFRACGQQGFKPDKITPPVCATDGGGAGAPTVAFSSRMRGPEPKVNRPARPPHAMIELTGALEAIKPWNVAYPATAFKVRCGCEGGGKGYLGSEEKAFTVSTTHDQNLHHDTIVRRLTPMECERLQGFPDDYTRIPWRNKAAEECPDGPRYKALGNSMAVPVLAWIGRRIQLWEDIQRETN